MAVRIDTKEEYWTVVSVYASEAGCPVYEKDEFYLSLDEAIRSFPDGDSPELIEWPRQESTPGAGCEGHPAMCKGNTGRNFKWFQRGKEVWFWNNEVQRVVRQKKSAYKRWQCTQTPEDLATCRTFKRLAKAVAKAKSTKVDTLYEKLDTREGEKFMFRLAKARHRANHRRSEVRQEQRGCNPEEAWRVQA
nr:endonuclease-reverse transcriptase HmRTE-e01 [Haemonchus contortus]